MSVLPFTNSVALYGLARRLGFFGGVTMALANTLVAEAAQPGADTDNTFVADDNIITLAAYNVKADRIEDFGFRVSDPTLTFVAVVPRPEPPFITTVLPNTAADKAGLQPGDRILKSDGRSAGMTIFTAGKWLKFMRAKNAEAVSGKKNVTWTLEIRPNGTNNTRTVTLTLPTPPPNWGSSVWRPPEGRKPSAVGEPGPLAERCREVLDHGIWTWVDGPFAHVVAARRAAGPWRIDTGYEWRFGGGRESLHRILVTQAGGRTDVFLDMNSSATGRRVYLTSPSGALEKAWRFTRKEKGEISLEEARVGFEHELDLWATKVERGTGRWPFEIKVGYDANAIFAVLAPMSGASAAAVARPVDEDFLKLPAANDAQRELFSDAYGKIGADQDGWAYTETSRGLEHKRVTVTRIDPSKPESERCVLVSINGKPPTPAEVQRWRDDGGDMPKPLGDIPPLASIVDLEDLRIHDDETAAMVFELPIRSDNSGFPSEQFQALFRVNKTYRSFEDITVKMRDSIRIAGVVKITEAGLHARFQTIDPAHPPQPVLLKGGGVARVLLVKFSRDFETTRSDFTRVEPFVEPDLLESEATPLSMPVAESL